MLVGNCSLIAIAMSLLFYWYIIRPILFFFFNTITDALIITMEVFQLNFLRLKTIFKNNFYFKICRSRLVQSDIRVATKKYFNSAFAINWVLLDIDSSRYLMPKLYVWPNGVYLNFSDNYVPTGIYDIFKFILSILFLHYYLKYFMYTSEWKKYKWPKYFISIGSYIGIFTIDLMLSCIALIKVPSTTFGKIQFVILLDVSYLAYYTACTTDWFDKYIYSICYTYTSTVNHNVLKDRQYLIVSNLATRWHTKNVNKITQKEKEITQKEKEITQKEKKIVQSAPQDPRLNRDVLVNNIHSKFISVIVQIIFIILYYLYIIFVCNEKIIIMW